MITKIQPFGDAALLLTFGDVIEVLINSRIVAYTKVLKESNLIGVIGIIPAYTTITVQYDALKTSYSELKEKLESLVVSNSLDHKTKIVKIPVCYDAAFSKDIDEVIDYSGLTKEKIIELHTSKNYLVYMLGFTPGFFYLGGMDTRLYCPRKEKPRLKIEAGSVGIAGSQTGVYSMDSPGGWQVIGKTPLSIFDKNKKENYFLVNQGDVVQFYEVSLNEFKTYIK